MTRYALPKHNIDQMLKENMNSMYGLVALCDTVYSRAKEKEPEELAVSFEQYKKDVKEEFERIENILNDVISKYKRAYDDLMKFIETTPA